MRFAIALHVLRRGHRLRFAVVSVPMFDSCSEGLLVECSCGKEWAL